jgi:hypothetical protein
MVENNKIEKFSMAELTRLRQGLLQEGIDSRQSAELVATFLSSHGYGVNNDLIPDALLRLEGGNCSVDCIQLELERVAFVM